MSKSDNRGVIHTGHTITFHDDENEETPFPLDRADNWMDATAREFVNQPKESGLEKPQIKSDGGPSGYYDFQPGWVTFNDFAEAKAVSQWGAFSIHLKDIGKALFRFGAKDGTSAGYDSRKIVYSGIRLIGMIEGKSAVRAFLQKLLDDPQFK